MGVSYKESKRIEKNDKDQCKKKSGNNSWTKHRKKKFSPVCNLREKSKWILWVTNCHLL